MHKALHPRDDVDRLYVSRKEGERGLARIEDTVDASIQQLKGFIEKHGGLITAIRNDMDNTIDERMTSREKLGGKTTLWPLKTSSKQYLTPKILDLSKKGKP